MNKQPSTLDELKATLAEHFHCMTGPPRAYFELADGEPTDHNPVFRVLYVTLAWAIDDEHYDQESLEAAKGRLVDKMWQDFLTAWTVTANGEMEGHKPILFWRREPDIEVRHYYQTPDFADLPAEHQWQAERNIDPVDLATINVPVRTRVTIRCRVWVSGYVFQNQKPEGVLIEMLP